jgi:hypothetical protein
MSQSQVGLNNSGNQADYVLGTAEGWDAFGVVRWHGVEEISHPYVYEITLQRQLSDGAVDLDALLDAFATFRIASQGTWRTAASGCSCPEPSICEKGGSHASSASTPCSRCCSRWR